ncbi:MAG TPA: hypothetical protein VHO69_16775, partial [Phototrophicaceae bacterium]|nr:hypothetical protein [Phototrophicaceae bacterium]
MTIDQQTLAALLQLGGQYFVPVAALLRALYDGIRGKLPEGFRQITLAGLFAGVMAAVTGEPIDVRSAALTVLSNSVFYGGPAGLYYYLSAADEKSRSGGGRHSRRHPRPGGLGLYRDRPGGSLALVAD